MGNIQVICKTCLAVADLPPDTDPHAVNWCGCCTIDHHHGRAECAAVPGHACWQGPQAGPRPDDCQVCRPVLHMATAGAVIVSG
jgi:hypothetical protein